MFGYLTMALAVAVGGGIAHAEDRSPWIWGGGTLVAVIFLSNLYGPLIGSALALAGVIVAATIANYRRKL